jgi:SAM-dependent methyltransferase
VTDPDVTNIDIPLSHLPPQEKAKRAGSFGGVASHYERYRPGPPVEAVDWILPRHVATVVDLGAGTGALTRLLIDKADEVIAVEPDDRMRSVLTEEIPGVQAVMGRAESMPLAKAAPTPCWRLRHGTGWIRSLPSTRWAASSCPAGSWASCGRDPTLGVRS